MTEQWPAKPLMSDGCFWSLSDSLMKQDVNMPDGACPQMSTKRNAVFNGRQTN